MQAIWLILKSGFRLSVFSDPGMYMYMFVYFIFFMAPHSLFSTLWKQYVNFVNMNNESEVF